MRRAALAVVVLLGLAGTAVAGQFDDAVAAYSHGDYATAARLFRPLAEQGDADAQNNLGIMYENGYGVPQDYVSAHLLYSLAATRKSAGEGRDKTVKNRDRVAAKMTPAQIAEAERLAREWKPKAEDR